jgi:hypothetical protein
MHTCHVQVDYSHLLLHTYQCAMGTWLDHVLLYCQFSLLEHAIGVLALTDHY